MTYYDNDDYQDDKPTLRERIKGTISRWWSRLYPLRYRVRSRWSSFLYHRTGLWRWRAKIKGYRPVTLKWAQDRERYGRYEGKREAECELKAEYERVVAFCQKALDARYHYGTHDRQRFYVTIDFAPELMMLDMGEDRRHIAQYAARNIERELMSICLPRECWLGDEGRKQAEFERQYRPFLAGEKFTP